MLVSENGNTLLNLKSGKLEAKVIKIKNTGGSEMQEKIKELEEKVLTLESHVMYLQGEIVKLTDKSR